MTNVLRLELAPKNIRVSALYVAYMDTDMLGASTYQSWTRGHRVTRPRRYRRPLHLTSRLSHPATAAFRRVLFPGARGGLLAGARSG